MVYGSEGVKVDESCSELISEDDPPARLLVLKAMEGLKDEMAMIPGLEALVESKQPVPADRVRFYLEVLESAAEAREAAAARLRAQIRQTAERYPFVFSSSSAAPSPSGSGDGSLEGGKGGSAVEGGDGGKGKGDGDDDDGGRGDGDGDAVGEKEPGGDEEGEETEEEQGGNGEGGNQNDEDGEGRDEAGKGGQEDGNDGSGGVVEPLPGTPGGDPANEQARGGEIAPAAEVGGEGHDDEKKRGRGGRRGTHGGGGGGGNVFGIAGKFLRDVLHIPPGDDAAATAAGKGRPEEVGDGAAAVDAAGVDTNSPTTPIAIAADSDVGGGGGGGSGDASGGVFDGGGEGADTVEGGAALVKGEATAGRVSLEGVAVET